MMTFEKMDESSSSSRSLLGSTGQMKVPESVQKGWTRTQETVVYYARSMVVVSGPLLRRKRETLMSVFAALFLLVLYLTYTHMNTTAPIMGYNLSGSSSSPDNNDETNNANDHLIPHKIWQIYLTPPTAGENFTIDPSSLGDTASWLARNPDYTYTLVSSRRAEQFMQEHFSGNQDILSMYGQLRNPGMKSDFLRYLLLYVEGGTYADTDVYAHKAVDQWIPTQFRDRTKVIVGVEFDRLDNGNWGEVHEDLQICQWTIAAAPGHPLFMRMVYRAMDALRDLETVHNTTLSKLKPQGYDVINSTGPASWTDAVFEQIQLADPEVTHLRNLSRIKEPRLYGDMLLLPIDSFGMGQPHSDSTNDGTVPETALIQHNFRGSWRNSEKEEEQPGEKSEEPESRDAEEYDFEYA